MIKFHTKNCKEELILKINLLYAMLAEKFLNSLRIPKQEEVNPEWKERVIKRLKMYRFDISH